jgi:hypothetical protein
MHVVLNSKGTFSPAHNNPSPAVRKFPTPIWECRRTHHCRQHQLAGINCKDKATQISVGFEKAKGRWSSPWRPRLWGPRRSPETWDRSPRVLAARSQWRYFGGGARVVDDEGEGERARTDRTNCFLTSSRRAATSSRWWLSDGRPAGGSRTVETASMRETATAGGIESRVQRRFLCAPGNGEDGAPKARAFFVLIGIQTDSWITNGSRATGLSPRGNHAGRGCPCPNEP